MSEYVIITDTTTDLSAELIKDLDIIVIPMVFEMSGKKYTHYSDYREMDVITFYNKLRGGETSVTSQINPGTFTDLFEPILESGKDILYLAFSSALSGTYQSSIIAKDDISDKYPDRKICIVDTKAAALGEGMFVYNCVMKKREGMSIDELTDWATQNVDHVCHWFTVDDLNHLKRGGRIGAASAAIGTALGIKPVLHVDDEGHLVAAAKIRGRKKSLDELISRMEKTVENPQDQVVFIGHGDCLDDAKYVANIVKEKFGVKDIIIGFIGPIIGTHSGPGTVALFFMGSKK